MSRVIGVAVFVAAMMLVGAASAADQYVLQLNGPAQFEFAGYYAALWQGFYRDAGIDVVIKPGAGQGEAAIDPVREVTEGRAQFGTGTAELVVRAAQGQPLLLLAPIFQRSGAGVYYQASDDYASPGALAKAKVGRLPASDILDIELATALKAEGVDPGKLNSVALQPGQGVGALADHSVDAVPGSAWDFPWLAHEKGFAVKSFNPADYRVEFYGDTLFTLRRLTAAQPKIVRSFRAATLKGWDYALQHPDEISARLLAELPHPPGIKDAAGFAAYQAKLAVSLARYPSVALGHSNPDRWNRIEASMIGVGALARTDSADFVFDPDAAARQRTDRRALAILGATLLVALAITLWFWRRWRARPAAAAAPALVAGAAPATPATAAGAAPAAAPPAMREPAPADLNAVLSRLDREIRRIVPRRMGFRLSLLPDLWRCRAEPGSVPGLVLGLVAAAAADLKDGGELIVGTRNFKFDERALAATPDARLGEFVRLTVRDNGPGLNDAALARILDPAATARPAAAAAAAALRPFGGFARVESAEGVGTAVHLYFPRAMVAEDDAAKPGKPPDKPREAAA
jgi:ABC-type nitrate/sulfonate/bicarbonate transport system substrate-binding protein